MMKIKIFFAGSMYGGEEDKEMYKSLTDGLKAKYNLLSDHVAYGDVHEGLDDRQLYQKDIRLINEAQLLVAEVSAPSVGTGYEIAMALHVGKRVVCLYRNGSKRRLSMMLNGNPSEDLTVIKYDSAEEALVGIDKIADRILND